MKVSLYIVEDSWNSRPVDELELAIGEKVISFYIKGENERKISIYKRDLARIARLCEEEIGKAN